MNSTLQQLLAGNVPWGAEFDFAVVAVAVLGASRL